MPTGRPTLDLWIDEYLSIEDEYLSQLRQSGIDLAPQNSDEQTDALNERKQLLIKGGLRSLNGDASLSRGFLSSACQACVGGCGSRTFYINLKCRRGCYFCFNPNQVEYASHIQHDLNWKERFEQFRQEVPSVTHVGLTGGEPLLYKEKTLDFLTYVHTREPQAHLRLYTSGDGFDEAFAREAAKVGLDEIRFSIKLEEGQPALDEVLEQISLAKNYIPTVMVEMPVAPGEVELMKEVLCRLDEQGVDGINLLELCYPMHRWNEFAKRGLMIKNPPFEVLYEYDYAGALPISGSEQACLDLLEFAQANQLSLGVHYCSLANKNIDTVLQRNRAYPLKPALYELGADGFYRVIKVFDQDVEVARALLDTLGVSYEVEDEGASLLTHPRQIKALSSAGLVVAKVVRTIEKDEQGAYLRELSVRLV